MAAEGGKKKEGTTIIIKKVKKGHGGHHGGAWKVAYADFVTAMMAFFLLMWLINSVKPETKAALSKYFSEDTTLTQGGPPTPSTDIDLPPQDPTEQSEAMTKSMELEEELREIVDQMLSGLKDQIIVKLVDGNVRIEIVDKERNPLFASGSSELSESAKKIIKEMTKALFDIPNMVVIEGHTDAVNFSTTKYTNWELSTERASAARKVLETSGLPPERIAMVAGYASSIPFVIKNPLSPENRRISIVVLPPKKNIRNLYKD